MSRIKSGLYEESVTISNPGTREAPVVFESVERWGAVMSKNVPNLIRYASGDITRYIVLRGISLKTLHWPKMDLKRMQQF